MPRAQEVDEVASGILVWQAYDSKVKVDLFSTALETQAGTYVVDPIALSSDGLLSLRAHRKVAGIFVTNANHGRAAAEFAKTFSIPIYVHDELRGSPDFLQATRVQDGEVFSQGLTAVAIDGGPAGETALHHNDNGGTMVLGDALINFEPHGFGLLPAKYCLDAHLMRRSLGKLLDYAFDRILFAHGTPILSGARARVEQLLATIR
jgi:Metallo-beta-lactamase superfamily